MVVKSAKEALHNSLPFFFFLAELREWKTSHHNPLSSWRDAAAQRLHCTGRNKHQFAAIGRPKKKIIFYIYFFKNIWAYCRYSMTTSFLVIAAMTWWWWYNAYDDEMRWWCTTLWHRCDKGYWPSDKMLPGESPAVGDPGTLNREPVEAANDVAGWIMLEADNVDGWGWGEERIADTGHGSLFSFFFFKNTMKGSFCSFVFSSWSICWRGLNASVIMWATTAPFHHKTVTYTTKTANFEQCFRPCMFRWIPARI